MMDMVRYSNGSHGMTGLLGWNPFRMMNDLVGSMADPTWATPVEYEEDDERLTITIDVPGVYEKDLDVTLVAEGLIVNGKREGRREFHYSLRLPSSVDPSATEAHLEGGVLTVSLPKRPEARPRRIAIQGATQRKSLSAGASEDKAA